MKKEKSTRKSRKEERDAGKQMDDIDADGAAVDDVKSVKKKKKSKKESKKRSRHERDGDPDDVADEPNVDAAAASPTKGSTSDEPLTKEQRKAARAAKKAAKAELKSQLLSKLPQVDSDGIPYNKIQIRRMLRRVKNGLAPIPTEQEEREIRAREKREKIEEEALYAEQHDDGDEEDVGDEEKDEEEKENDGEKVEDEEKIDSEEEEEVDEEEPAPQKKYHNPPPKKKTKRNKPVPPDYICQACKNDLPNFTPHWIYDCPLKKTNKGCNAVSKKLRGLKDPPSRKVFVSGLPFECTEGSVKRFFEETMSSSDGGKGSIELVHCKLLKFEDSNRCKGQAFLTFDTDDAAKLAIKVMNGSTWKEIEEPGMKTKKKKKDAAASSKDKKELKLKVTKVLNRFVTKKKGGGK